jgi:CRP-like cAMP-binding protein
MTISRTSNRLLLTLSSEDLASIEPHLTSVDLPLGTVLYEDGDTVQWVYFPLDCVVSIVAVLADGTSPEMVTVGREGIVGLIPLLGNREAFGRYIVQLPGRALRMTSERVSELMTSMPRLRQSFFCYLQALAAQTFQSVACNAVHPIEARCCRWILMTHDRVRLDQLALTHEFLAAMLGVHRPTVSIVARTLQAAGLIEQQRGVIRITDRQGLEEAACECYHQIRGRFERLLPMTYTG